MITNLFDGAEKDSTKKMKELKASILTVFENDKKIENKDKLILAETFKVVPGTSIDVHNMVDLIRVTTRGIPHCKYDGDKKFVEFKMDTKKELTLQIFIFEK